MKMSENNARSKEVLNAMGRQGLKELGAALYPAGTVAQHPEYGMIGTRTPGEVADGLHNITRTGPTREHGSPSQLQAHLDRAPEPGAGAVEPVRDLERD